MKATFLLKLALSGITTALVACGGGGPSGPTFGDLITEGWAAFQSGDYQSASDKFSEAITLNDEDAAGFTGLGWSLFRLENLSQANTKFTGGSNALSPPADLFAGWAFVKNAQKDYTRSNQRADDALALNSNWVFTYDSSLGAADLHVLKAENYFLLGEFADSLAEVQILNPNFSADVSTNAGQAALAQEIENLNVAS